MFDSSTAIVISVIAASLIFVVYERRRNNQDFRSKKYRKTKYDSTKPDHQSVEYRSGEKVYRFAKRVLWWSVKITCGGAAILGTFYTVFSAIELYFLLSGRIAPDFEQPPVPVVFGILVAGLILMIVGYMAPKWLDIDRLR